jgi:hypothetical protein
VLAPREAEREHRWVVERDQLEVAVGGVQGGADSQADAAFVHGALPCVAKGRAGAGTRLERSPTEASMTAWS